MRTLERNKRTIYYALRIGENKNKDENGFETGETTPVYSKPIVLRCNVSAAMGAEAVEAFGGITGYTRTMCVADTHCPINEDSVIWFGIPATEPYNYIVLRKADSKNGIIYALQEVSVK
jgi:hypothetical protein